MPTAVVQPTNLWPQPDRIGVGPRAFDWSVIEVPIAGPRPATRAPRPVLSPDLPSPAWPGDPGGSLSKRPVPLRRVRGDALPEQTRYRDDGCDIHPHCLTCPLPRCRYDEPGGLRALLNTYRDQQIMGLRQRGAAVDSIAHRFHLSRRTVFRILSTSSRQALSLRSRQAPSTSSGQALEKEPTHSSAGGGPASGGNGRNGHRPFDKLRPALSAAEGSGSSSEAEREGSKLSLSRPGALDPDEPLRAACARGASASGGKATRLHFAVSKEKGNA